MQDMEPTLEDWKSLYEAAIEFSKIGSWKWMADDDLFGVQNPATGEISYCCIMGMAEEVYGLSAYSGTRGLEGYLKVQSGEVLPEDIEAMVIQDSLTVFYEDRAAVQKEDMDVIKSLGLKFRGRNVWPIFREYKPGYHPWFFTKEETLFFTILLEQVIDVALRFKDNKTMLAPKRQNHYFVRVPSRTDNKITWKDEWLMPASVKNEELPSGSVDEIRIRRIMSKSLKQQGTLEIDCFLTPEPIQERKGERPFYPDAVVVIEHTSGMVADLQLANHSERRKTLQETFLHQIETSKLIPKKVLVRKEEVLKVLEPLASGLNVSITVTDKLKHMDNFKDGLFNQIFSA